MDTDIKNKESATELTKLTPQIQILQTPATDVNFGDLSAEEFQFLRHDREIYQNQLAAQNHQLKYVQQRLLISRSRYNDFFESAPVSYLILNESGVIIKANIMAIRQLNSDKDSILGNHLASLAHDNYSAYQIGLYRKNIINKVDCQECKVRLKNQDGTSFLARLRGTLCCDEKGNLNQIRIVLDVDSEQASPLSMQANLNSQSHQSIIRTFTAALEQTTDSVFITDTKGTIKYVNNAFIELTGYSAEEALGKNPRMLNSGKHDKGWIKNLWGTINQGKAFSNVFINRKKDGSLFYEEKTISPMIDDAGFITHYVSTGKDISERIQTQERLHYLAYHDVLTELPNRTQLNEILDNTIRSAKLLKQQFAVVFIDLDHFKKINDSLGHDIGDSLLQNVAKRLSNNLRHTDTAARLGGDEFAAIIPNVNCEKEVRSTVNHIIKSFEKPFKIEGNELYVTPSIGISLFPEDGVTGLALLKNADIAMYQAKFKGRNTFRFFSSFMGKRASEKLTIESDLHRAHNLNQFELHYQPQIDFTSGRTIGVEALLRWQHPDRGLLLPNEFIPHLEDSGLIISVGKWIIQKALSDLKCWQAKGATNLKLAVNLSAFQFKDKYLVSFIKNKLISSNIDATLIEFEITETSMMDNVEATINILRELKSMGVGIAIDDFGTGYSSLSYLNKLPIESLKIDQSFIADLSKETHCKDNAIIVKTIIAMAKNLDLSLIAEGVETTEQCQFLSLNGCNQMQGNLFSPAIRGDKVIDFIQGKRLTS